jgi:two-component system cell cycle response regulator
MNALVLLVGDPEFSHDILKRVRGLKALAVNTVASMQQAETLMADQPPNLVVVQVSQIQHWWVFQHLKQQPRLSGIYFLLVDDRPHLRADLLPLQETITALEAGADAYLGLPKAVDARLANRLLQAQVKLGLQRSQIYRDLARTNDWLSAIALVDALTQLNNRHAFDLDLPRQIKNARAKGLALCLIVLDIDYFKSINDTYGHLVGDAVLQLLSERLRNNMRFYDTPFRYGGEEFVVILSDTDLDEAAVIGNRLCKTIAARPFELEASLSLQISVSIGIAGLTPTDDERGRSLLHRADQNLLRAKAEGRNRVVITPH